MFLRVSQEITGMKWVDLQVEYPPLYQRHVWNYAKANKDAILSALQNLDWHRCLLIRLFIKK